MRQRLATVLAIRNSRLVAHFLVLSVAIFASACAAGSMGGLVNTASPAAESATCQIEVWNDNETAIEAWYDPGRNQVGTIPAHDSVIVTVPCSQERVLVRATEVGGTRDVSTSVVPAPGETKIAQLSLP